MFPSIVQGGGAAPVLPFLGPPTATGTIGSLPATTVSLTAPATTGLHAWRLRITQAAGGATAGVVAQLNAIATATGTENLGQRSNGTSMSGHHSLTDFRIANAIAASKSAEILLVWDYTNKELASRARMLSGVNNTCDLGAFVGSYTDATAPASHTLVNTFTNGFAAVTWERWDHIQVPFPYARCSSFLP